MTNSEYLYENAPLIEVIAEVHWALKALQTAPSSRIDPYYDLFREQFLHYVSERGLINQQELVPSIVPPELFPNQPQLRIRKRTGRWPLAQVGPGILTANIVPPYNGWREFSPFVGMLIDGLFQSYPMATKTLRVEKLHLRYINGFGQNFGYGHYAEFAQSMLGIQAPLPQEFEQSRTLDSTRSNYLLEYRFLNTEPRNSIGLVRVAPGTVNGASALVMELHCESKFEQGKSTGVEQVKSWFEGAHDCISLNFDALATQDLKAKMGERREVS